MSLRAGAVSAAVATTLLGLAGAAHARLVIDEVDTDRFQERSEIRFFISLIDDVTGKVRRGQVPKSIKVFIDDVEVPGAVDVKTFKEAQEALDVAILIAAHDSYASSHGAIGPVLVKEKSGFERFMKGLTSEDRVAVWAYTSERLTPLVTWSNDPGQVAERIEARLEARLEVPEDRAGHAMMAPPFYGAIRNVIGAMAEDEESESRRRVLVVVSDGRDTDSLFKPAAVDAKVRTIAEDAVRHGIRVYALGFSTDTREPRMAPGTLTQSGHGTDRTTKTYDLLTTDIPDPLLALERLAVKSKGRYRAIDRYDHIADEIAALSDDVRSGCVVTDLQAHHVRGQQSADACPDRTHARGRNGHEECERQGSVAGPIVAHRPISSGCEGIAVGAR